MKQHDFCTDAIGYMGRTKLCRTCGLSKAYWQVTGEMVSCHQTPEAVVRLDDWLDATELVNAYAYRIYHADADTITCGLTMSKEKALKMDAYPIELKPTLLMR